MNMLMEAVPMTNKQIIQRQETIVRHQQGVCSEEEQIEVYLHSMGSTKKEQLRMLKKILQEQWDSMTERE